jgi:ArsR family transcriptional regulator
MNLELDVKRTALIFKAFCDENRIKILQMLLSGEKCACRLLEEMNITQPTLSHHMKILCDSGIVTGRKEGKWMHYSISDEGVKIARKCFDFLTTVNQTADNCCDNDCK